MLTCEECGCCSDDAKGWLGLLVQDPEEELWPQVALYCPPCGAREHATALCAPGYI
jgi:hypothetical protein